MVGTNIVIWFVGSSLLIRRQAWRLHPGVYPIHSLTTQVSQEVQSIDKMIERARSKSKSNLWLLIPISTYEPMSLLSYNNLLAY